jgi:BON domain
MRIATIALLIIAAGGCAHQAATTSAPASVTQAYRDVRSGAQPTVAAGGVRFCATPRGLDVVNTAPGDTTQWNDVVRGREIEWEVRRALREDPSLRGQNINVKTSRGEVYLTGQVASDADAVRAAQQAANVSGVVFVNVALTSPESPGPVARMDNPSSACWL